MEDELFDLVKQNDQGLSTEIPSNCSPEVIFFPLITTIIESFDKGNFEAVEFSLKELYEVSSKIIVPQFPNYDKDILPRIFNIFLSHSNEHIQFYTIQFITIISQSQSLLFNQIINYGFLNSFLSSLNPNDLPQVQLKFKCLKETF